MASDKPGFTYRLLDYDCSWVVLYAAKHASNHENGSSKDAEVGDDRLEKCILWTLWAMLGQLQAFLLPVNFELDRKTSQKH